MTEGESGGGGLRRRKVTLLGKDGEEEEEEEEVEGEEYSPPPAREEEMGLSLNKCILGAVLLLGLGTIFFSGEFREENRVLVVWCSRGVLTASPQSVVQLPMSSCLCTVEHLCAVMWKIGCIPLQNQDWEISPTQEYL